MILFRNHACPCPAYILCKNCPHRFFFCLFVFYYFFCHLKVVSSILGSQVYERSPGRYPARPSGITCPPKLTMRMLTVDVSSPGTDLGNELLLPLFVFGLKSLLNIPQNCSFPLYIPYAFCIVVSSPFSISTKLLRLKCKHSLICEFLHS